MGWDARNLGLGDTLLPFTLDATGRNRIADGWILAIVLVVFLWLPGFWLLCLAVRRSLNPLSHPLARALARFGAQAEIAAAVEAETPQAQRIGAARMSPNWLWFYTFGTLELFRLDDIVWVHKSDQLDSSGNIVGCAYTVCDCHGVSVTVQASQDEAVALLAALKPRIPWTHFEFSSELADRWEKNRAALVAEVMQRRARMEGHFRSSD